MKSADYFCSNPAARQTDRHKHAHSIDYIMSPTTIGRGNNGCS